MAGSTLGGLAAALRRGRNVDGGWGYYAGKASRIEPTCWVALCLARAETLPTDASDDASRWLAARQRPDGFIGDGTAEPPNVGFNGLAALAVRNSAAWSSEGATRLINGLGRTKGLALKNDQDRQDNTLQGWPWIEESFSWVEPTAWCMLAMKISSALLPDRERAARIDEAERLLLDRMCQTGGWNYGNSNTLGRELSAHVPTTALALLALQDRRDHPSVRKSIEYLTRSRLAESAGMALSLTSICLRVYGVPAPDVNERLAALAQKHAFFGNLHIAAMALYSLTGPEHDVQDFRL
ncbi:MAG TPA: prenyltransferase/squalene oxidase repeat-containing protein [Vicinamibacterales bacterium]|nr:prenyltransferase/squalene oxidase repeat-containing protein [Vicinamibacterales bacterium]